MFSQFIPDIIIDSVYNADTEFYRDFGSKCIILDIDNTLVSDGTSDPDERAKRYVDDLKANGFFVAIASNNSKERAERFCRELDVFFTFKSGKPKRRSLMQIAAYFGIKPNEITVVGDQILTDILMAKRCGAHAVLVKPINPYENGLFYIKRLIEKPFIRKYYRNKRKVGK